MATRSAVPPLRFGGFPPLPNAGRFGFSTEGGRSHAVTAGARSAVPNCIAPHYRGRILAQQADPRICAPSRQKFFSSPGILPRNARCPLLLDARTTAPLDVLARESRARSGLRLSLHRARGDDGKAEHARALPAVLLGALLPRVEAAARSRQIGALASAARDSAARSALARARARAARRNARRESLRARSAPDPSRLQDRRAR